MVVVAHSIPVVEARRTRPPLDPFEYRWRRALLQVCGTAARFVLRGAKKTDETSTQSTGGTGGGAS